MKKYFTNLAVVHETYYVFQKLLFLVVALFYISSASAYRLTDDDVVVQNGVITQCTYDISTLGNIIEIPKTLDGQTIIGLGDNCFQLAGKIKEVNLPSTLKTIGDNVFKDHNLTQVDLPEEIESIGNSAFMNNNLTTIFLPGTLTHLGNSAFSGNLLIEVDIPTGLTVIHSNAFFDNKIEHLSIPDNITSIESFAFKNNYIQTLSLPNAISHIGDFAFHSNSIISVNIPQKLKVINAGVFQYNQIEQIIIPDNVTAIHGAAFNINNISRLVIPNSVTTLGEDAFRNNRIEELLFAEDCPLTVIPKGCFSYNKIIEVNLSSDIKIIEREAFRNNRELVSINFNQSLCKIGKIAFNGCDLGNVTLPNSLIYIGEGAFFENSDIKMVLPNQPEGDKWLVSNGTTMNNGDKIIDFRFAYIVSIPYTLQDCDVEVNGGMITKCFYTENIENKGNIIVIPTELHGQKITDIGHNVFNTAYIQDVSLPESLYNISDYAFFDCDLRTINLPASVKNIGAYSFTDNCIMEINFEDESNLKNIGFFAFCANSLTELRFPSSLNYIGEKAFMTNALSVVAFENNSQISFIESYAFDDNHETLDKIILPESLIDGYQFYGWLDNNETIHNNTNDNLTITNFDTFYRALFKYTLKDEDVLVENGVIISCSYDFTASMIYIPNMLDGQVVTGIGNNVFNDKGITHVTLPSTLVKIESGAFSRNKLTGITIPASVEYIGNSAFYFNKNIEYLNFESGSNLSYIGSNSFQWIGIDSLIIPASVEYIGDNAFFSSTIDYLKFENGSVLNYLGTMAFAFNGIGNDIVIPTYLKEISPKAFYGNNIGHVTLHNKLTDIGKEAFSGNHSISVDPLPLPQTIPFVTWFIRWRDSDDSTYYPGDVITDFSKGYRALIDEYFHVKVEVRDNMGLPIEGATIQFSDSTMRTNTAGIDSIAPVLRGEHNYLISAEGYITEAGSIDVQDDVFLQVTLNQLYYIIYELNGGQNAPENPASYTVGSDTIFLQPAAPTINTTAYFAGWYDSNDQLIQYIPTGSTGDITLSASFTSESTFLIEYENVFDGTHSNPHSYTSNDLPLCLTNANREKFDFMGWYSDASFTSEVINIASCSAENITLYAKWALKSYNIDYEVNGGVNNSENPTTYNTESPDINFLPPSKVAYNFDGWYVDEEYKLEIQQLENGSTGDTTLYAQWEPVSYTITYQLDGGTNAPGNPVSYTIETPVPDLQPAQREGYLFEGWYSDNDFTQQVTSIQAGSTGNVSLYAKWEQLYMLTFNITTDGTTPAQDVTVHVNQSEALLSGADGQAELQCHDNFDYTYKVELDNIEITSGEGLIEGSGQVVDVAIVDAYMRWYDVLFCDNGKQLWSEFEWSDANNVVSTEQFYHNEGGIESGQYWLNVTSQSGKQYTWTKYYENNQFKVAVYPNPVSKSGTVTVNIEGAGQLGNCELRVYNFTGQMVKTIDKVSANNQIRFSGELPNGLYQVVLFENGRHRSSHQLIVR